MENKHHQHFMLYKPYGYICQFITNQRRRKNKKMLGELHDFPEGTMSIGRLDQRSEGLLLLTTDGKVSAQVRSKTVEKEYYVQVDGIITEEAIAKLREGVEITVNKSPYMTLPAQAKILENIPRFINKYARIREERHGPTSWASVTVTEGKFRQVRKMTAAVGFPTLRLIRVRIGNIQLGDLEPGQAKEIDMTSFVGVG